MREAVTSICVNDMFVKYFLFAKIIFPTSKVHLSFRDHCLNDGGFSLINFDIKKEIWCNLYIVNKQNSKNFMFFHTLPPQSFEKKPIKFS